MAKPWYQRIWDRTWIERIALPISIALGTNEAFRALGLILNSDVWSHTYSYIKNLLHHWSFGVSQASAATQPMRSAISQSVQPMPPVPEGGGISHVAFVQLFAAVMVVGVYLVLIGCFVLIVRQSTQPAQRARAWDLVKIIAGFFLGNLTTMLK